MYGLIGRPLGHSFSASFFNDKFQKEHINEHYELFPLQSIEEVKELIDNHPSLHGFNVTIPYKQEIIPFLSKVSDEAREIGAVNVVKILRDSEKYCLEGYNSDAFGFRDSIQPMLKPYMKKAIILGTGGAAKAISFVMSSLGFDIISVSRSNRDNCITYSDIDDKLMSECHVIINATPLGMWPKIKDAPHIPYEKLTPKHLLFDLIYNPEMTEFMKRGLRQGAIVKNGLEMLYGQALEAWRIWNE